MATADIVARLKLNGEGFSREFDARMRGMERSAAAAASRVKSTLSNIAGAFGVSLGATAFTALARDAIDYAGSLSEVARAAGVTVEQYQVLARAALDNGASQEAMSNGLSILNRTLGQARAGVPAAVQAFRALRIDPEQFTNAGEALPGVMDRIRGLRTESEQAAIAQRLMGRGAAELLPFLTQGAEGYRQMEAAARDAGLITSEMAARADEAQDKLAQLEQTIRTQLGVALVDLIPDIEQAASGLGELFDPLADGAERSFDSLREGMGRLSQDISRFLHEIQDALNFMGNAGEEILYFLDPGLARRLVGPRDQQGARQFNFADRYDRGAQDRALDQVLDHLERERSRPGYHRDGGPYFSYVPGGRSLPALGDGDLDLSHRSSRESARARTPEQLYRDFERELQREGLDPTSGYRTYAEQAALQRRLGARNAAAPGTSAHEFYRAFDFSANVDREAILRAAQRADVRLEEPKYHGDPRHLHQVFADARSGGGGDGERELERQLEIVRTMERQTAEMVEQSQLASLRRQGVESQAELEERLGEVRRRATEDLERISTDPRNDVRREQENITEGLEGQLTLYRQQGEAYARLLGQYGAGERLTKEQRAELDAAADAMHRSLQAANETGTTIADNRRIQEDQVLTENSLTNATERGTQARVKRGDALNAEKDMLEQQERMLTEMKEEAHRRGEDQVRELAGLYRDLMSGGVDDIWGRFTDAGMDAIAMIAAQWTLAMMTGQRFDLGSAVGGLGAGGNPVGMLLNGLGLFGGGKGGGGDAAGSLGGLASAAGSIGGKGGLLAGVGSAVPYAAAAFAAFSLLDGLGVFKSTKRGSATLGYSGGELGVGSTRGNSGNFISQSSDAIDSLAATLERIAETLGGEVTGAGSVSIGVVNGKYRVDTTGSGSTNKKLSTVEGFGDDLEAALRFALQDALQDRVIGGISAASQKILKEGKDLERAIAKALMIEEIPRLLKARLDPVGAALDALDEKWEKTIAALKEGGATAEQMAEAQQLYKLELQETIDNTASASAALKDFLNSLKVGPASPYSLTQQEREAEAALKSYLDQIHAGDGIDQDKYQAVAEQYLDIERQIYGSTEPYFAAMDKIMAATSKAIERIDNAVPIRTLADPFHEKTATNTGVMAEQLSVLQQQSAAQTELLGRIVAGMAGGGGWFIGGAKGFAYPRSS